MEPNRPRTAANACLDAFRCLQNTAMRNARSRWRSQSHSQSHSPLPGNGEGTGSSQAGHRAQCTGHRAQTQHQSNHGVSRDLVDGHGLGSLGRWHMVRTKCHHRETAFALPWPLARSCRTMTIFRRGYRISWLLLRHSIFCRTVIPWSWQWRISKDHSDTCNLNTSLLLKQDCLQPPVPFPIDMLDVDRHAPEGETSPKRDLQDFFQYHRQFFER